METQVLLHSQCYWYYFSIEILTTWPLIVSIPVDASYALLYYYAIDLL